MIDSEISLSTKDGLKLFGREWAVPEPRGVILLIHGLGEHCGRYSTLIEGLNAQGFTVLAFDQRGHGKSAGKRGHAPSYELLMDDLVLQQEFVHKRYQDIPVLLYGHSLGGNLAINFVLRRKPSLKGVIITSPWLQLAIAPPASQVAVARVINKICPSLSQDNGLDTTALTRQEDINSSYLQDPLVHSRISVGMFLGCNQAGEWAMQHASSFYLPLLLMHGTGDRITSAKASKEFAERVDNCSLKLWEGLYHELHNEQEGTQVTRYVIDWINSILK